MGAKKPVQQTILMIILLSLSAGGFLFSSGSFVLITAAQSAGDTIATPTPRPAATSTPNPPAATTSVEKVWVGRLATNTLGATKGEGSIFRVSVEGILDTPIELRIDDKLIMANSGSKPEYGTYAAEFAPVTAGTWTVSVPALGASIEVTADNYNLAIIEFVQIPAAEATHMILPTPTPTPLGATTWEGEIVNEKEGAAGPFARLLVRVVGRDDQPVRLSTISQVINTANTGQKPTELGPNMVEFAGLTPGKYIVEPVGLNVSLEVELKPYVETSVEFRPLAATATPISTPTTDSPTPIPLLPISTFTPAPSTPTSPPTTAPTPTETVIPTTTETAVPSPSPTSISHWLGVVESRMDAGDGASSIIVNIKGIEGLSIRLSPLNRFIESERRCMTGRDGLGQDVCAFNDLPAGQYTIEPEGLRVSLPVELFEHEALKIYFNLITLPPGISGWQAQLHKNTNGFQVTSETESIITVRVAGRPGQVVLLRSAQGAARFCEVVHNPVLGGLVCEFGKLRSGVYHIEAITTGASRGIFVDGKGEAIIEFSPNATQEILASLQSPSVVGHGARPNPPVSRIIAAPVALAVQPTATETATPAPKPSPTPAFAWRGRIIETTTIGSGAIGVRAAGLNNHPVVLHSGNWQSQPQMTGTKVELGEYGTEFAGLGPGEYRVELVNLAELWVTVEPGQFVLVEFRYEALNP